MKRIALMLIFVPLIANAMDAETQLQMLNAKLTRLEAEHAQKYAELKQCEQTTKNFKIAGISTLGATAVGLYANMKLHEKLSKLKNKSSGGGLSTVVRTAAQQKEQDDELCKCCSICEDDKSGS